MTHAHHTGALGANGPDAHPVQRRNHVLVTGHEGT